MICPRCETDVTEEDLYCPYCSLPKPRAGFAAAPEEAAPEHADASERPTPAPPVVPRKRESAPPQTRRRSAKRPERPSRQLRLPVLSVAAVVALLSVGAYIFIVPLVYSSQAEPKVVSAALDTLRKTQSNEPGVTIDVRLMRELEKSRKFGNLVSYQGWTVRQIPGTARQVVLVFSFQERDNTSQRAEWLADLSSGAFTPQTELAASVTALPSK